MTGVTALPDSVVHVIRTATEADEFCDWLDRPHRALAVDVETTGLAFTADVRLVQVSDQRDAWVWNPHEFPGLVENVVHGDQRLIMHNAQFDALHLARLQYGDDLRLVATEAVAILDVTTDTALLSHLLDPRGKADGGAGHDLKGLSARFVDAAAPDGQAALLARFKELGYSKADGFRLIDRWDPVLVKYAAMDALLTARLEPVLTEKVEALGLGRLVKFDHDVQKVCAAMTARGMAVAVDYARQLCADLEVEQADAERQALIYGVTSVNSTAQVSEALMAAGHTLTERTDSGLWKIDKAVLAGIDHPLARLVETAKYARKMRGTWLEPILAHGEVDGRAHCRIRTVAARTYRMSITDPPLQTLPATDHRVRSTLIADPGMVIATIDFNAIELRVMSALAGEDRMIETFIAGDNFHDATAERMFGPDWTAENRRTVKGVAFGWLYGSGPKTLAKVAGISQSEAKKVIDNFERSFPRAQRWARQSSQRVAFGEALVVTPTGRRIPVDRDRSYRATNYVVSSLAADLYKGSLLELSAAGFDEFLLVPVHDEIVCQLPVADAEDIAHEMATVMGGHLGRVPIVAEAEISGPSWGTKYSREAAHA